MIRNLSIAVLLMGGFFLPVTSLAQEGGAMAPSAPSLIPEQVQKAQEILRQQSPAEKLTEKPPEVPLEKPGAVGTPPAPSERALSPFEEYIQGKAPLTVSTRIQQFGYDLFKQPPITFAPVEAVPVGPDYLLGPGDEVRITLWGKVNADYATVIDRDGKISLPQIGILHLSGLTFAEAKTFIEKEFSRYYQASEVKINVSMGRLRTVRVFVVGKTQKPGSYTLSSLSTLINALFAAGGPSKIGTMRDIQVKRNGETLVHFDLYDFLLKGDKTKDVRLMPEDVVFIPIIGPLVGIAGNVKNPAIYELRGEARLLDLIEMAGGLMANAFKGRVQVQRIEDHQGRTIFEGDLVDIEKNADKNFYLRDGDLVKIFPVVQLKTTILIAGAVASPGEYGVVPGVTKVNEVISLAGGLLYYASTQAELTRVKVTQEGPKSEQFVINLAKAAEGDPLNNIPLEINDYLFVRAVPEWELYRIVAISGEVKFPGIYTTKKAETLSSLIKRAGGFTNKAYLKGAIFSRESVRVLQQKQLDESIDRLEQQILFQSAATIETALTPEAAQQQKTAVEQRRSLLAQLRAAKAKGRIAIQLDGLERFEGSPSDVTLEEGDTLIVPEQPQQVQVIGAVYNQTALLYEPEATVSSYMKGSGGMTASADTDELYVLKIDGTAISQREMGGFLGFGGLMSSRLDPGDTIVVPGKVEAVAYLREVKDFTQILYQIAITTGVIKVLFAP